MNKIKLNLVINRDKELINYVRGSYPSMNKVGKSKSQMIIKIKEKSFWFECAGDSFK